MNFSRRTHLANRYKPTTAPTGAPAASYELALTNPDFKFPQIWRSNIAVDQRLPWRLVGTVELLYNKEKLLANGDRWENALERESLLAEPLNSRLHESKRHRILALGEILGHLLRCADQGHVLADIQLLNEVLAKQRVQVCGSCATSARPSTTR